MKEQLTGTRLGDYHVRELLGSGGMANVYKGYDPALDRDVAIKVINTSDQPADFVARFQREARVVARLRHPNIVQIYHFGVQQSIVYMVQELLPGPTLDRRLREAGRRRLTAERVQTIVAQLAQALDFAHSQGVIHRDVKPSNALYNSHGQLVLTDFGIARSPADATRTATGPGVVMGTPGYLAPEQAISSATLTPACDVYALGVVLFELLTLRLPFEADTPMGVVLKHLYDDPPLPSSLRADLPPDLDKVVLKALHKEPSQRYASTGALAQAVQAAWPAGRAVNPDVVRTPALADTPTRSRASRTPTPSTPPSPATPPPKARAVGVNTTPSARRTPQTPRTTPKPAATASATPRTTPKPAAPPARSASSSSSPARRATPAASAAPATPATRKAASTPVAAPPRKKRSRAWVGLLTLDVVGALLLFGMRPQALSIAWEQLLHLVQGLMP